MAIQPLQLPPIINLPQPDFSVLGSIGQDLYQAKMRSQAPGLVADAFGPQPNQPLPQPTAQETGAPLNALGTGNTSGGIGSDYVTDYSARAKAAESSGNPSARNPNSSAGGLYQFTDGTWLSNFDKTFPQYASLSPEQKLAYKTDASPQGQQVQNAVFKTFTNGNAQSLSSSGLPVNNTTLYAAHFFGAGDAPKVLTANPSAPLASVVQPSTIAANPFLANMTVGQAQSWLASKMGGQSAIPQNAQPVQYQGAQPQQPQAAMPGLTSDMAQKIGAMLTNPYTAQLGQALLQKYAAPSYGFQTLPDGTVVRTDTLRGTVQPVYQAQGTVDIKTPGPYGTTLTTTMQRGPNGTIIPLQTNGSEQSAITTPPGVSRELMKPDPAWNANERAVYDSAPKGMEGAVSYGIKLARGQAPMPTGYALKTPWGQAVMDAAQAADPTFNPMVAAARQSEYKDYYSGTTSQAIKSLNTLPRHIASAAKSLNNLPFAENYGVLNAPINALSNAKLAMEQSPQLAKAKTELLAVATEFAKAMRGVGAMSEREIQDWEKKAQAAQNPAAIKEVLSGMADLAAGRIDVVQSHWDKTMGPNNPFEVLDPRAKEAWTALDDWRQGKITADKLPEIAPGGGAKNPPNQAVPKVQSYSDVTQSLSNAKTAIANGAPRDAVIKRLIDGGVPPAMANRL